MRQHAAQTTLQNWVRCCAGVLLSFCTEGVLGFAYEPSLMKGRNVYVTLERDASGVITSSAIAPDPNDPAAWAAPTYPSTYLCRTAEQETDRTGCRSYVVYIPLSYDGTPLPLHLSMHGNGGFAEAQIGDVPKNDGTGTVAADNSGLEGRYNQLAEQHGFFVAYLNGIPNGGTTVNGRMFNDCRIGEPASTADDVQFIGDLLDDLQASLGIDARRVYSHGYSNGAMMTLRLYQEMGERFAAFATTAGNQPLDEQDECRPLSAKKPLLMVFGDEDVVVPYYGAGVRVSMRSADETIRYWTEYLGAESPSSDDALWMVNWDVVPSINTTDGHPDSVGYWRVYKGGTGTEGIGETQVAVKKINQGGHAMSGLTPFTAPALTATLGNKNLDVQLADELYAFFSQFALQSLPQPAETPSPAGTAGPLPADESGFGGSLGWHFVVLALALAGCRYTHQ